MHPFVFPAHSNIIILLLSMFFGRMYPATRCSYQKIILVAGSSNFVFQFNGYFTGQESALSRDRLFSVVEVRPSVMMITTFHAASFFAYAFFSRNSSRHSASFILALASWSPLRSKKKGFVHLIGGKCFSSILWKCRRHLIGGKWFSSILWRCYRFLCPLELWARSEQEGVWFSLPRFLILTVFSIYQLTSAQSSWVLACWLHPQD